MKLEKCLNEPFNTSKTCQINIKSTMFGLHWYMHEHDEDINEPSCPHCHAKEKNWKLNIYTGDLYEYPKKTYKGKITKKELKRMWAEEGFLDLVISERNWYYEKYYKQNPKRYPPLPALPIVKKHGKVMCRITAKWINYNRNKVSFIKREYNVNEFVSKATRR